MTATTQLKLSVRTLAAAGALALVAAAAPGAAVPPQPTAEEQEIVVLGSRLTKVKIDVSAKRGGAPACRIKRSSGDRELDTAFCGDAAACVAERPKNGAALSACMMREKDRMIAALAALRARAREAKAHAENGRGPRHAEASQPRGERVMTALTRERVIREIDGLAQRVSLVDHRLRNTEGEPRCRHLSFADVRSALDETAQEVRLAKQFTCENGVDFRQIELILTDERQSLSAISQALDRVEQEMVTSGPARET
jgi:hypothetical protein